MSQRWKIFTVLAVAYILAYFYRVSMAVVAKDVSVALHLTPSQLGTLSGVLFYSFALSQLPLGPLLDRFGGRRILSIFGLITAVGSCLFAMAPSYHGAVIARILLGVGTSCALMGSYRIFVNWFSPREFVVVSGLIMAVGNLGNLSATAPLAMAVEHVGWRGAFFVVAGLQVAIASLIFITVRDQPTTSSVSSGDGQMDIAADAGEGWRTIFSDPSFWLLALISFFWYGNYMVIQGLWGGPYLMDVYGVTRAGAGKLLLFTALGYIVGSLLIGRVGNDLLKSRKKTLLLGQVLLLLLMLLMLGPAERLPHTILGGVFFAIGLVVSSGVMIYPLAKEMFSSRISATAMTAANFFVLTGAAVVQQVVGVVVERFPSGVAGHPPQAYHAAFLFPIVGLFVAIVLFAFSRDPSHH